MHGSLLRPSGVLPAALILIAACGEGAPPPPTATAHAAIPIPALPGSLGPNLATGSGGPVLSWLEPDGDGHALRYARWDGAAFVAPSTVTRGDDWFVNWADFPSVVPIADDFWVAHWLRRRPAGGYAYDVETTVSIDGGRSWSTAVRPHRDDTDTEHGFVSIYPTDTGAGLVWLDGRRTGSDVAARQRGMTLRAATLTPEETLADPVEVDGLVCDCCQTDVTLTDSGPVAVYRDRTRDETRDIYAARRVDGAWQPGRPVAADGWTIAGCPVNGPVAASRGDTVIVAWFTNAGDVPRVRLARSDDGAATFGTPVDVARGDAAGRVGLALVEDGRAVVSWLRNVDGAGTELILTPLSADGEVGAPYPVSDDVVPLSVPQLAADGDGVLVIWTRGDGGSRALAGARVALSRLTG